MLLIIQGEPYAGKTTMAKAISGVPNWVHLEPYMAFSTSNEENIVDPKMFEGAKQWCYNKCSKLLLEKYHVVVVVGTDIKRYQAFCDNNDIHYSIIRIRS